MKRKKKLYTFYTEKYILDDAREAAQLAKYFERPKRENP